jgi:hypothetical protein
MRKLFFSVIFIVGVITMSFAKDNKKVIITLNFSPLYSGGSMVIYDDSYQRLNVLMVKLSKARSIGVLFLSKEALPEGTYSIDIYSNDVLIQSYEVLNSENVRDKTKDRYLKCDVLSNIYNMLVHHFLQDRINRNL